MSIALRCRSRDEIHEADNFFGRVVDFILKGPLIAWDENGEMQIRRDEDLERLKSRFNVVSVLPPNDFELGFLMGKHLQLAYFVQAGEAEPVDLQAAEECAWGLLADWPRSPPSDHARGVVYGRISAIRWVGGKEWDAPYGSGGLSR